jgi:tetratricopeptide (TPR) repeat protein
MVKTPRSQIDLRKSLNRVGDAAMAAGDIAAATLVWQESLDIARDLAAWLQTPQSQRDLSVSLNKVGDAAKAAGDIAAATLVWQESLDIARDLAARLQTPQNQLDLAASLDRVGDASMAAGDLATAAKVRWECLSVCRTIAAQQNTRESQSNLDVCLKKATKIAIAAGDQAEAAGDLAAADIAWREGLEIVRELAIRLQTHKVQQDLSLLLFKVGMAAARSDDEDMARRSMIELADIRRALAAELDTPQSRGDLFQSILVLAMMQEDPTEQETLFEECERLSASLPEPTRTQALAAILQMREFSETD